MKSLTKHIFKTAALITGGLIIYFLAMVALGLEHNFNLRVLNALIMFAGVFLGIREFKNREFDTDFGYLSAFGTGFFVSLLTAIAFSLFLGMYLVANPSFLTEIQMTEPQGVYINEIGLSLLIFIEALASGILFTYTTMQVMKDSTVTTG